VPATSASSQNQNSTSLEEHKSDSPLPCDTKAESQQPHSTLESDYTTLEVESTKMKPSAAQAGKSKRARKPLKRLSVIDLDN
jgi:hypothetical protein